MKIPSGVTTNYQKQKFINNTIKSKFVEKILKDDDIPDHTHLIKYVVIPSHQIECEDVKIDYSKEKKILMNGFDSPILIKSENNKLFFIDFSLSDLLIAKKHNMLIPAIILDYENIFPHAYQIKNEKDLVNFVNNKNHRKIINSFENIKINTKEQIKIDKENKISSYYNQKSKTKLQYATKHNMS